MKPRTSVKRRQRRVPGERKNSDLAKERIISAAVSEFARHGYKGSSTEQIAEAAGYSQSTLFFHFKSKEGLLKASLEHVKTGSFAGQWSDNGDTSALSVLMQIDARFEDQSTSVFFARMLSELLDNRAVKPVYSGLHREIRETLANRLAEETGVSPRTAEFASLAMISLMVGIHVEQSIENEQYPRAYFSRVLEEVAKLITQQIHRLNVP